MEAPNVAGPLALMRAIRKARLNSSQKAVAFALLTYADKAGANAWPSVTTLADDTALQPATTRRALHRLVDQGVLLADARHGRPTCYQFCPPEQWKIQPRPKRLPLANQYRGRGATPGESVQGSVGAPLANQGVAPLANGGGPPLANEGGRPSPIPSPIPTVPVPAALAEEAKQPAVPAWVKASKAQDLSRQEAWEAYQRTQAEIQATTKAHNAAHPGRKIKSTRAWQQRRRGKSNGPSRQLQVLDHIREHGEATTLGVWRWFLRAKAAEGYGGHGLDTFLKYLPDYTEDCALGDGPGPAPVDLETHFPDGRPRPVDWRAQMRADLDAEDAGVVIPFKATP